MIEGRILNQICNQQTQFDYGAKSDNIQLHLKIT